MPFTADLRNILFGRPFGEVFPPKPNPLPLAIDGRTAALYVLREYVANLTFFRQGAAGAPPIPFRIPEDHFFIEWPDSTQDMTMPCIAVVQSRGDYDVIGLVSYVEEDTRDLYLPGTVLQWQSEYVETINLEIWVSKQAERRAVIAAMETAFSPTEQMSGLRFQMPDYFDELVCFTLNRCERMDEPDASRNRRRAQLELEMRFNVVALVNYAEANPRLKVNTDVDEDTQVVVDLSNDPNAQVVGDQAALVAQEQATNGTPNPIFTNRLSSWKGGGIRRG